MWTASVLACLALACASDDYSLMQQGSIALQQATANEVQGALQRIGSALRDIPYPGKMRQMAIDALMKSVSSSEKIDESTVNILQQIITLLDDILANMKAENTNDQDQLDLITNRLNNCNAAGDVAVADTKKDAEDGHTLHNTCREQEQLDFDDDALKCSDLTSTLNAMSPTDCSALDHHDPARQSVLDNNGTPLEGTTRLATYASRLTLLTSWDTRLSVVSAWFSTNKQLFETKAVPCEGSTDTLSKKKTECDQAQSQYENLFCLYRLELTTQCSDLDTCWQNGLDHQTNLTDNIKPIADQRHDEARVIEHVKCLVQKLIDGVTDHQPCEDVTAADATRYQTDYNVTYPDLPAKDDCDTTPVAVYPCGADEPGCVRSEWITAQFANLATNQPDAAVNANTGVNC